MNSVEWNPKYNLLAYAGDDKNKYQADEGTTVIAYFLIKGHLVVQSRIKRYMTSIEFYFCSFTTSCKFYSFSFQVFFGYLALKAPSKCAVWVGESPLQHNSITPFCIWTKLIAFMLSLVLLGLS